MEQCNLDAIGLCRVGDLSKRQGTLEISGKIADSDRVSRKVWTDTVLPLTGSRSILGKSVVLFDDHGPKARGERLACSRLVIITKKYVYFPNLLILELVEFIEEKL